MVRVKLMDGSYQEIRRDDIRAFLPAHGVFSHSCLRTDAVFYHLGKVIPVHGPLPEGISGSTVDDKPWLLLLEGYAQVILGLPAFDDDVTLTKSARLAEAPAASGEIKISASSDDGLEGEEEAKLLQEMEELLKAA